MKNITNNTEIIRTTNGGGRWGCRVCGYSNKNFSKVFWHAAGHVGKTYLRILSVIFHFL